MPYDLVIKNGVLIDGSGLPRHHADVAVRHGRIAAVGRIRERAREVMDADGLVVAPGFIDGHTHMDAQIFWDPLGTCSCWHGVTTVVMGNCGFTLAPCPESQKHLVVRNRERAEGIAAEAMAAGIEWKWTTFPEFLDCLDALPKGINYAGYLGHCALRTYVMGELAFEQAASEDDIHAMERELRDAIRAGAIGFTTSRSPIHETPDGRPVASRLATWDEVRRLVGVMGDLNAGLFELAGEAVGRELSDPVAFRDYHVRLRDLAVENERPERRALGTEARPFPYEWIFLYDTVVGPHRTVAEIARERGVDPAEAMIDLALEKDLDRFFVHPVANEDQDTVLEMMRHPRAVVTFSDSGAHVSQIVDSSLQTHLLSHWVRAKQAFTLEQAVRMLTLVPATYWGFADRGLVREGFVADLIVFDPDTISPEMPEVVNDLPAGARRLVQRARGIAATIVNGEVLLRDGKHTGALPGQLLRGPLARRP